MSVVPPQHEQRFRHVYAEHFDRVLGYALRRTDRSEDAAGRRLAAGQPLS